MYKNQIMIGMLITNRIAKIHVMKRKLQVLIFYGMEYMKNEKLI